jgi:hypothetical protein
MESRSRGEHSVGTVARSWQDHGMRFRWMLGACGFAVVAAACGDGAAPRPEGGALVLEVGGDHSSLREALRTQGVLPADPQRQEPGGAVTRDDERRDDDRRGQGAATEPPAPPTPAPSPSPAEDAFFVVELADGQTLVQLARKHLGNGNRFPEILELNGWTEADSRRLRAGQKVKIPRSRDAQTRR